MREITTLGVRAGQYGLPPQLTKIHYTFLAITDETTFERASGQIKNFSKQLDKKLANEEASLVKVEETESRAEQFKTRDKRAEADARRKAEKSVSDASAEKFPPGTTVNYWCQKKGKPMRRTCTVLPPAADTPADMIRLQFDNTVFTISKANAETQLKSI